MRDTLPPSSPEWSALIFGGADPATGECRFIAEMHPPDGGALSLGGFPSLAAAWLAVLTFAEEEACAIRFDLEETLQ